MFTRQNIHSQTGADKYSPYIQYHLQGADKSLARPRRKKTTPTKDFDFFIYKL
jgi:hypothetical protein